MNELEAKSYLTKKGGANNSDHTCILYLFRYFTVQIYMNNKIYTGN